MKDSILSRAIAVTIRRPVTTFMLLCSTVLIGVIANSRIPLELIPSGFVIPTVSIRIPFPGANPIEVEEQVTRPTEDVLRRIGGLESITTSSSKDSCQINIQFARGVDPDEAFAEVRDFMELAKLSWPDQVQEYLTFRFNLDTDLPVLEFGMLFDEWTEDLAFLVDERIVKELETVDGVARVDAWGIAEDTVRIFVDRAKAQSAGVSLFEIAQAMGADNRDIVGGRIEAGGEDFFLRSLGRFQDLDEIRRWPVRPDLALSDVAEITTVPSLRNFMFLLDGQRAIWFRINKESSANTVDVCSRIRDRLANDIEKDPRLLEAGYSWFRKPERDIGNIIESALDGLVSSALIGGLLAILPLLFFLRRVRLTLIIILSIPTSLLITLGCIHFTGGTLNMLSMMGITIAIGMLVDNSIVVTENIFRHRALGATRIEAAVTGTGEVALAVTLATLTTVMAFLPLIFMDDAAQVSFFTRAIGLPVCYAVMASLLVALLFIPLATVLVYRKGSANLRAARWIEAPLAFIERAEARLLGVALRRRFAAVVTIVALCLGVHSALAGRISINPESDESGNFLEIEVRLEPNFTLKDAYDVFGTIHRALAAQEDEIGLDYSYCFFRNTGGSFYLRIDSRGPDAMKASVARIRDLMPRIAGARIQVGIQRQNEEQTTIRLTLNGPELDRLCELGEEIMDRIEGGDGVLSVKGGITRANEEIVIEPDRERVKMLGVDPRALMGTVQYGIAGQRLRDLQIGDQQKPMLIEFDESADMTVGDLASMAIWRPTGAPLPLSNLADIYYRRGYGSITKKDGKLGTTIVIEPEPERRSDALASVVEAMRAVSLPPGYSYFETSSDEGAEEMKEIGDAGLLAVVLIVLLMGILFESCLLPLAVFVTIPFALLGGYWCLALTRTPLDVVGYIGAIVLVGIVVNNGIVFLDCAHRLAADGLDRRHALLEAARLRLRPILMTTSTTVVGLLPMALAEGSGSFISYTALARGIIGGLLVSTAATMVAVPMAYTILADLRAAFGRVFAAAGGGIVPEKRRIDRAADAVM